MFELTAEQEDRVWGEVANRGQDDLPFVLVDVDNYGEGYTCEVPDGICFVTTSNGEELAALIEYQKAEMEDHVWIRIIDEEMRGMAEDELADWIFGEDRDAPAFALVAEE